MSLPTELAQGTMEVQSHEDGSSAVSVEWVRVSATRSEPDTPPEGNGASMSSVLTWLGSSAGALSVLCIAIGYVARDAHARLLGLPNLPIENFDFVVTGALFSVQTVRAMAAALLGSQWWQAWLAILIFLGLFVPFTRKYAEQKVPQERVLYLVLFAVLSGWTWTLCVTSVYTGHTDLLLDQALVAQTQRIVKDKTSESKVAEADTELASDPILRALISEPAATVREFQALYGTLSWQVVLLFPVTVWALQQFLRARSRSRGFLPFQRALVTGCVLLAIPASVEWMRCYGVLMLPMTYSQVDPASLVFKGLGDAARSSNAPAKDTPPFLVGNTKDLVAFYYPDQHRMQVERREDVLGIAVTGAGWILSIPEASTPGGAGK